MILYKNVDICNLDSIMKNGILSMDECHNNNWGEGRRADNDTSVVYLFKPFGKCNSFPEYGTVLLEVDCDAVENQVLENDIHKSMYAEYVVGQVRPDEIRRVIIPAVFKEYINVPDGIDIMWCDLKADIYGNDGYEMCSKDLLTMFAKTAKLTDSSDFNFFRGSNENRTMIDLYNVQYLFE